MKEKKNLEGTLDHIRECCIEELKVEKRPGAARKGSKKGHPERQEELGW